VHEFAICSALIPIITAEMKKFAPAAPRLKKVRLVAGALRQIVPEAISFAFEVLTKDTPLEGAVLEMTAAPIVIRCRACNWRGEIEDLTFVCKACSSTEVDLEGGQELQVESLVIEQVK
jgi:hydrogenase nickel incorporation protein HypA/HybF